MNFEQFNAAMCALRQAEEDFNKALGDVFRAINEAAQDTETEDFRVGDEVTPMHENNMYYNKKCIFLDGYKCGNDFRAKLFCIDEVETYYTVNLDQYIKTGKHYDSIPLPKEETKE